jgi:hypothetical protein
MGGRSSCVLGGGLCPLGDAMGGGRSNCVSAMRSTDRDRDVLRCPGCNITTLTALLLSLGFSNTRGTNLTRDRIRSESIAFALDWSVAVATAARKMIDSLSDSSKSIGVIRVAITPRSRECHTTFAAALAARPNSCEHEL